MHDPIWNHVVQAHENRKITKHPVSWTTSRKSEDYLINFLIHDCRVPPSSILVTTSEQDRNIGWASATVSGVQIRANVGLSQIEATYKGRKHVVNEPADLGQFLSSF